jgi:hypothetical protein
MHFVGFGESSAGFPFIEFLEVTRGYYYASFATLYGIYHKLIYKKLPFSCAKLHGFIF